MRSDTSDAPSTHAPAGETETAPAATESKEESKVETKAEPVEHAAEASTSTSTDAPAPAPVHSDETKAMLDSTTAHKEEKGE